jgi:hypothetical protein
MIRPFEQTNRSHPATAIRRQLPSTELKSSMRNRIPSLSSTMLTLNGASGGKMMDKCARSPWIVHSATTRTLSRSSPRLVNDC